MINPKSGYSCYVNQNHIFGEENMVFHTYLFASAKLAIIMVNNKMELLKIVKNLTRKLL